MSRRLRTATILGAASVLASLSATGLGFLGAASPPAGAATAVTTLFAWGDNSTGELGDGSTANADAPIPVSLPAGVVPDAVAGGGGGGDNLNADYAGYAIGSDHKLYAWGDNSSGELGDGSLTPATSDTPVVVSMPTGVTPVAISAAQGAAYAIGSDGNLYAWGDGGFGKLGDGSLTNTDTPVVVAFPTGVTATAVAGGYESAYAIGSDGKVYAWGDDLYGELGDGTNNNSATPVVVGLPAGVKPVTIAGGGGVGYAIGSDGNLYSWGLNAEDQLGDGSTSNSNTPVVVSMPVGVTATAVSGGGGFAHVIGSDGNLYGWGLGTSGQLGVNTDTGMAITPVLVTLAPASYRPPFRTTCTPATRSGPTGISMRGATALPVSSATVTGKRITPRGRVAPARKRAARTRTRARLSAGYAIVSATPSAPQVTAQPQPVSVRVGLRARPSPPRPAGIPHPPCNGRSRPMVGSTFTPVSGGTNDTLTIASTTIGQNGNEYEAVFSNGTAPDATTNPAVLTVTPHVAPSITLQPMSQTGVRGDFVSFTSTASGDPDPTVAWQVSSDGGTTWSDIDGNGTSTSDTLRGVVFGTFENGWEVQAVFTNDAGSATTNPATLTVSAPTAPTVTLQPTEPRQQSRRRRHVHGHREWRPQSERAVAGLLRRWDDLVEYSGQHDVDFGHVEWRGLRDLPERLGVPSRFQQRGRIRHQ